MDALAAVGGKARMVLNFYTEMYSKAGEVLYCWKKFWKNLTIVFPVAINREDWNDYSYQFLDNSFVDFGYEKDSKVGFETRG